MNAQIEALRTAYATIKTINPEGAGYKKLIALLDSMDNELLKIVSAAGINFVSLLAYNRCMRRGIV